MTRLMTTDAVLTRQTQNAYDFSIAANGDILTDDFFDTSILIALFTDKRATAEEMPVTELRRGWIGDESNADGFEGGSKIWLYEQAKLTRDTLNGLSTEANNALAYFVEDNIAISVLSSADLINGAAGLTITITRPNSRVDRRFFELWNNTAKRG